MAKKIIGLGKDAYQAMIFAEAKLPFPLYDSSKYLEIEVSEPKLVDGTRDGGYKVEISYTLKEDKLPSEKEITGLVRRVVAEELQRFFDKWKAKATTKIS